MAQTRKRKPQKTSTTRNLEQVLKDYEVNGVEDITVQQELIKKEYEAGRVSEAIYRAMNRKVKQEQQKAVNQANWNDIHAMVDQYQGLISIGYTVANTAKSLMSLFNEMPNARVQDIEVSIRTLEEEDLPGMQSELDTIKSNYAQTGYVQDNDEELFAFIKAFEVLDTWQSRFRATASKQMEFLTQEIDKADAYNVAQGVKKEAERTGVSISESAMKTLTALTAKPLSESEITSEDLESLLGHGLVVKMLDGNYGITNRGLVYQNNGKEFIVD